MSAHSDFAEKQRLEVEALASIYGDRFTLFHSSSGPQDQPSHHSLDGDVRPINKKSPYHFKLRLVPHPGDSNDERNHASVVLEVTFTPIYPKKAPLLQVIKDRGLSTSQLKALRHKVTREASNMVGEEMIFSLAQSIQDFLLDHNHKQISFYEQMIEREKKEAAEKKLQLEKEVAYNEKLEKLAADDLAKLIEVEKKKKKY